MDDLLSTLAALVVVVWFLNTKSPGRPALLKGRPARAR